MPFATVVVLLLSIVVTPAAVLWSDLGATLAHETGPGLDILGKALQRDNASSDTLYFKIHVDPLSDVSTEEYFAAFQLYQGDEEKLGVGNSQKAWAYSAFNTAQSGEFNKVLGDIDLRSARPESSAPGVFMPYELPRRGIENTIVFKVHYVPNADDDVTVWLNPDLGPGASESLQPQELVTRFKADASFNQIRLRHGGGGPGWSFSEMEIATAFEDLARGAGPGQGGPAGIPQISIRFWQREQGLPQASVHALLQDTKGYLWIGHDEGVTRFDGIRFLSFGPRDGLRISRAQALAETPDGSLWIGTPGEGLAKFSSGTFAMFTTDHGLPSRNITALASDPDGRLWVGTDAGLTWFRGGRAEVPPAGLPKAAISCIRKDSHGKMWVGISGHGIYQYLENSFRRFEAAAVDDLLKDPHCLLDDRSGRLWIGAADDYLLCQDGDAWRRYRIPRHLSKPYINTLVEDSAGAIWAGSVSEGLFVFHDGKLDPVSAATGLSDNFLESLLSDREGNIWVGTSSGLNRITRRSFSVFTHQAGLGYGPVHGLAAIGLTSVLAARPGDGLYRWDGRVFSRLQPGTDSGAYKNVSTLLLSREKQCWAGGAGGLFMFEDPANREPPAPKLLVTNQNVLALYEDAEGTVWAGTDQGTVWKATAGTCTQVTALTQPAAVTAIAREKQGAMVIGTDGRGLARFSGSATTPVRYTARNGLVTDSVRAIYVDPQDVAWVGTAGGGLVRIRDGRPTAITAREGLPDDTVHSILPDNSDRLWLGTPRGIAAVPRKELNALADGDATRLYPLLYTRLDGLPSEQCVGGFSPAGLVGPGGKLWFPTQKGIVAIDPTHPSGDANPVSVVVEQLLVNGMPAMPNEQGAYTIPPRPKTLEIHYTGLSMTAPERVRFRYRLLGLDEQWVDADTRRVAYYGHVPPGHYSFELTACNNEGQWNRRSAVLEFTVRPHPWQTWWAITLEAVGALALVAFAVRVVEKRRTLKRLRQLEQERVVERERARIAQDLHDDLGSSLTRISLLADLLRQEPDNPAQAATHATRISQSAAQTVRALEEIVWALRPGSDTLQSLVEYLVHFANELFQNTATACRLDVPSDLPPYPLQPEIRHNLFLIAKEALTNALKHAAATEVAVRARVDDGFLTVEIVDNGKGYEQQRAAPLGRNGLSNMARRAETIGATLLQQSRPGEGTRVQIRLALGAAHQAATEQNQL